MSFPEIWAFTGFLALTWGFLIYQLWLIKRLERRSKEAPELPAFEEEGLCRDPRCGHREEEHKPKSQKRCWAEGCACKGWRA